MAKKNVIGLAKSGTATAKKPAARKPAARKRKPVVKEPTAEEIRDKKAIETVNKLLEDSPIVTLDKKEEDLLILDETPEEPKGVEWLEEQVTLQAQQIEGLRGELAEARLENPPAVTTSKVDGKVIELFNELQENYGRMGPNFEVRFPAFLNRMIMFFPFLAQHKKYK